MTGKFRSSFELADRVAIVTGACGIIGSRLCVGLAEFGADVAVIDLDQKATTALAGDLTREHGVKSIGIACDVSDVASVDAMVRRVAGDLGAPGILINNAATKTAHLDRFLRSAEEYDLETWRDVNAVNLDGAFLVAQRVGRSMIDRGKGGSIIQTASIYGLLAPDDRVYEGSSYNGQQISTPPVYAASKAAIVGLTRYLAARWAKHGVRVNTLTPGGVQSGQNEMFVGRYSARVPMGRMAAADDMVGAVIFLASDASAYITGQNIVVDGGLSAW